MRVDFNTYAIGIHGKSVNQKLQEKQQQRSCSHSYQMSIHDLQIFVCTKCDDMVEVDDNGNNYR